MAQSEEPEGSLTDRLVAGSLERLIRAELRRPYARRVPRMGLIARRLLAPVAGYRRRSLANLAQVRPDLPAAERRRIADEVTDNFGRTFVEVFSGAEFAAHVARSSAVTGPGMAAIGEAQAAGRPVILALSHFGNFCAVSALLNARGMVVGNLYRPPDNRFILDTYETALAAAVGPIFPRDRSGMKGMLRHVRDGGVLAIGVDQHVRDGAPLAFFGRRARTALTAAELALRHDVPLVPVHARRNPDGLTFTIDAHAPVPHGTPEAMMQAVNDDLEREVRAHMGQWLWFHRRWKGA